MNRRATRTPCRPPTGDDFARGLTEVHRFTAVGDDTRLGLEKMHWSVKREVVMPNDTLSVTSRIVASAPDPGFENSPSSTPQPRNQCRSGRPKASPDFRPVVVRQAGSWYESLPHDDSRRLRDESRHRATEPQARVLHHLAPEVPKRPLAWPTLCEGVESLNKFDDFFWDFFNSHCINCCRRG